MNTSTPPIPEASRIGQGSSEHSVPLRAGNSAWVTWPATRFYWAVLDLPNGPGAGPRAGIRARNSDAALRTIGTNGSMLPEGLLAEAQDALPLPIEDLHVVCMRAASGRLVICGSLREELAALDPTIERLTPEAVPELGEGAIDPSALNLRSGPFTSPVVLARRWRSHLFGAAVVLVAAALLAVGLWRHASAWNAAAGQIRAAVHDRLAREAPGLSEDDLAMKLPGLRASAQGADVAIHDAAVGLAAVLRAWPTQVKMQPPSLSVSASGVAISVTLDGPPEAFLHDFKAPAGFIAEEPRLANADRFTRVSMQLRPAGPSAGGIP